MLTLAIGNAKPRNTFRPPHKQSGFSLVEVMVALFIMGLMAGVVILNLPERDNSLVVEGRKFAANLHMASQSSLIGQYPSGVRFNEEGYSIVKYDGEEWMTQNTYNFGEDQTPIITLRQNGAELDMEEVRKSDIPVIRYDTTGLATPFELSLLYGNEKVNLTGGVDGRIKVETSGE